jgi:D-ribose pyranose/furanose isomerase RbsD
MESEELRLKYVSHRGRFDSFCRFNPQYRTGFVFRCISDEYICVNNLRPTKSGEIFPTFMISDNSSTSRDFTRLVTYGNASARRIERSYKGDHVTIFDSYFGIVSMVDTYQRQDSSVVTNSPKFKVLFALMLKKENVSKAFIDGEISANACEYWLHPEIKDYLVQVADTTEYMTRHNIKFTIKDPSPYFERIINIETGKSSSLQRAVASKVLDFLESKREGGKIERATISSSGTTVSDQGGNIPVAEANILF